MAVAAMTAQSVSAQKAIAESATFDNWYLGIEGGVSTKTTHSNLMKNANPHAGLRLGRYFTPVFGFAFEGSAYFNDKMFGESSTIVKNIDTHLLATVNLSNWFGGYKGKPRVVLANHALSSFSLSQPSFILWIAMSVPLSM